MGLGSGIPPRQASGVRALVSQTAFAVRPIREPGPVTLTTHCPSLRRALLSAQHEPSKTMGLHTGIEWCDSTCNPMMGCDGCELWTSRVGLDSGRYSLAKRTCYAGVQIERYEGRSSNFPMLFTEPVLYLHRLEQLAKWKDLAGKTREDKPWLNGLPRLVFLCDMGDPFTESLPLTWLAPHLDFLGSLPHIMILLTKRPKRMVEFSRLHPFPKNFWLMASVTRGSNFSRALELLGVEGGGKLGISYEPALGPLPSLSTVAHRFGWFIAGGESGPGAEPADPEWFRAARSTCLEHAVPFFFKQWGGVHKASTGRILDGQSYLEMPRAEARAAA